MYGRPEEASHYSLQEMLQVHCSRLPQGSPEVENVQKPPMHGPVRFAPHPQTSVMVWHSVKYEVPVQMKYELFGELQT
jgi:hypothetical protein